MSTLYRDFELNDFQETPWYDREIALFKDIIDLLPANGTTYVNTEHYHAKLVSPDGTVDPAVAVLDSGFVGVGIATPEGLFHIYEGNSPGTADAGADELIIESDGSTGLSILPGDAEGGNLFWDDGTYASKLNWAQGGWDFQADNDAVSYLYIGFDGVWVNSGGDADIDFTVSWDSGVALFCQGSDGFVGIGHNAPVAPLHVLSSVADGQELANTVLSVEGGTNGGIISILSDEGVASYIHFADAWLANGADIKYDTDPGTGAYSLSLLMSNQEYLRVGSDATSYEVVINDGSDDVNTRIETNGLEYAVFVDGGLNMVAIGHATPDRLLHIEQDTATTNVTQYLLRLTETCSDVVADLFGVGMEFELESPSQATNKIAGSIEVIWEDETEGDSDMIFKIANGWSVYEGLRLGADWNGLTLSIAAGSIDWSANQCTAFSIVDGNYGRIVLSTVDGGMSLNGYNKSAAADVQAITLNAFVENDPSDEGAIHLRTFKHDGSGGATAVGAAGKVVAVENYSTDLFAILGSGDVKVLPSDAHFQIAQASINGTGADVAVQNNTGGAVCNFWLQFKDANGFVLYVPSTTFVPT